VFSDGKSTDLILELLQRLRPNTPGAAGQNKTQEGVTLSIGSDGCLDEAESIKTIQHALDIGINLIDTAPVYGFGHSEEIVGKALADQGRRDKAVLATKVGLEWVDGKVYRNSTPTRIREEIEESPQT
jgi:aryl-alcohol dehydrogenase-like predicted oxidoreductase